ncbi:transglycosylase SLT domain-containing protein [uncultured Jatrophihabitans sp.]|uniref:transglycosylase SLT domain-containing protein n=1 Tax=uncultured Jatrophihabitans sp. TaxID=1610747 RepID=UPI0035CAB425
MTAPAGLADVTAIQAQMATVQAQLNALSGQVARTGTSSTSAAAFASQLSSATGATSTAGSTGTAATTTTDTSGAVSGADVVQDAEKYLGTPYVWGSESNSGLDCSGLVQKTFHDLGITVPRTAAEQQKVGTPVASLADAQPGDLLFFGKPAYHVAIYAGDGKLIESPEPGKTVHITKIYQQPTSISRIVDSAAAGTTSTTGGLSSQQLTAAGLNPAVATHAAQFAQAEQAYGLPSGMLAAVAQQESGGNTSAVSPDGAQGLMQLMPATARSHGVDAFDPQQAIHAAAQILHTNLKHFHGSVPLALAAYNAGAGAVERYGGVPPYTETRNYVRRITAMMAAGG